MYHLFCMSNANLKQKTTSSIRRYSLNSNKKLKELFKSHIDVIDKELSILSIPTLEDNWNTLSIDQRCSDVIRYAKLFFFNKEINNKCNRFGYHLESHCFDTALIFTLLVDELKKQNPEILNTSENKYMFSSEFLPYLISGVYIHDIGKLIPAFVRDIIHSDIHFCDLNKKLAKQYIQRARLHTLVGEYITKKIGFDDILNNIVRSHHERIDGSGYPDGNTNIPLYLTLLTNADILSSITNPDKIDQERIQSVSELLERFDKVFGDRSQNQTLTLVMDLIKSVISSKDNEIPSFVDITQRIRNLKYNSETINSSIILQRLFKTNDNLLINSPIISEANLWNILDIEGEDAN